MQDSLARLLEALETLYPQVILVQAAVLSDPELRARPARFLRNWQ